LVRALIWSAKEGTPTSRYQCTHVHLYQCKNTWIEAPAACWHGCEYRNSRWDKGSPSLDVWTGYSRTDRQTIPLVSTQHSQPLGRFLSKLVGVRRPGQLCI
jgi:hypothetical protein